MTRSLRLALVLATLAPAAVAAQQSCDQVLRSDFRRIVTQGGEEIMYYRNPVRMVCTGGVQIEADSAVIMPARNTSELVGRVLYRDGERQLTSDWAQYFGQSDELLARGNVVLTDMADGSVITGDDFEYRRETEARPQSHMIMRGQRPHAALPRGAAGAGEGGGSVLVWAQQLEFLGETVFLATGDAELEREDMRGTADALRFDQSAERMTLTGNAEVETDEYRLEGGRIEADMAGDAIREVQSDEDARLVSDDLTVQGRHIRIGFLDGKPERVEAWTPPAVGEEAEEREPVERAIAISEDFRLRADSIDARTTDGRLREVRAVGRAYGERQPDSLSVHLPPAIAQDWIQGDTITGYFEPKPPASPDEGLPGTTVAEGEDESAVVLERVEVIGGRSDALSLYRTAPRDGRTRPAVNFMRAERITLFMEAGEVNRVEADGPLEGLYLDPDQPRAEPTNGTERTMARRSP